MTSQLVYDQIRKQRGCEKLGITEGQWAYIKRLGTRLHNIYEMQCNGFQTWNGKWDEKASKRSKKWENKITGYVKKFAKDNKLYIYLQTDPRGASIYLDKKPIPENNYTRAVCVY